MTIIGTPVAILGKFQKQTDEVLDYDVDYTDWFSNRVDTPASFTAAVETGITMVGSSRNGNVVKVILSGGTNGTKYKVTVKLTTSDALVKEADFTVTVKDI
jgi:hypothetical protein